MPTTAWPSSRLTESILPTWMPEITTACPWPGVTACASLKSAVSWTKSSPTKGAQEGSEAFCWVKIHSVITIASTVSTAIAIESLPRPRAWRESRGTEVPPAADARLAAAHGLTAVSSAGPTWPSAPLTLGTG